MLTGHTTRLTARLVPRVGAAWPAIGGIALAVVLAHSGFQHLSSPFDVDEHYRIAMGSPDWTRTIGIVQMLIAGGLCFRRTRVGAAAALAVLVVLSAFNQWNVERAGMQSWAHAFMLLWALMVAWGEARQSRTPRPPRAPPPTDGK